MRNHLFYIAVLCLFVLLVSAADEKKPKVKKDPRDFTENDVNNLFEEWEVRDGCAS